MASPTTGELVVVQDAEHNLLIQVLARWAVYEQSKKQYVKVLEAQLQIVEGVTFYIKLEAIDEGFGRHVHNYEATIWAKDWENFLELVEFKKIVDRTPSATTTTVASK